MKRQFLRKNVAFLFRIITVEKQIDSNLIGYRDFKGEFTIIYENSLKKKVCDLYITPTNQKIEIDGEKIEIPDIDGIIRLKKRLIDKTLTLIE